MAKLSFLEIVGVALFTNVILWQATSSYTLGPSSSTVTEETLTTTTGSNSCDGIPCPTYKHCVLNTTYNSPQCVCLEVCTRIYAPVCGSDGRSYDNDCLLGVEACTTNIDITILRQGRCDDASPSTGPGPYPTPIAMEPTTAGPGGSNGCELILCPQYKHCVLNKTDNSPQCVCLEVCTRIYAPVCGSDGRSYDNDCLLGVEACTTNIEITILRQGRCDDATPSTGPGPYPTPIAMEPTTAGGGGGTPSGIPVQYTTVTATTQETMTTTGTGSNGCETMTCPVGEYCDLNADNRPACFCNDVCYLLYAPVCGSDGQTYSNDCFLGMEACKTNTTITILYRSGCGDVTPRPPYQTPTTEEPSTTGSTCPRFCPAIYDPVCGSDGKTYSSGCSLQVQACTTSTSITVQHNGRCDDATVTASTPANRRTKKPSCRKNKKDRRHRKDGL